jgi:hypothetical protein
MKTANTPEARKRTRLFAKLALAGLALVAVMIVIAILSPAGRAGRHLEFGAIYQTMAADLNAARDSRAGQLLRRFLPSSIVASRYFPERFRMEPRFMDVDGHPMEWSLDGPQSGWLYFHDLEGSSAINAWRFAPSPATSLQEMTVRNIPHRFHGANDPNMATIFGGGSSSNAISISVGQTLFAQRIENTNVVYVLRAKAQAGDCVTFEYCVFKPR